MHYTYVTKGTCSRAIHFDIDGDKISNVRFDGGCNGNLKGIASLVDGMDIDEVIQRTKGIRCGYKPTSCPDQLANALKKAKEKLEKEA